MWTADPDGPPHTKLADRIAAITPRREPPS